jgi:hypothetical protein
MRTFNVLLSVAGAVFVATCSSSLSAPDGGFRGAGGQTGTGGAGGAIALGGSNGAGGAIAAGGSSGTGGKLASGGTGGALPICGAGGVNGLGGFGGMSLLDAAVDASCLPNPLAGCPALTASSPCGPGAVCANSSQDGRVDIDTCIPVPSGCDSCSCVENALLEFAKQFPNIFVPSYACSCYEGPQRVDGGTAGNPITGVVCSGA